MNYIVFSHPARNLTSAVRKNRA